MTESLCIPSRTTKNSRLYGVVFVLMLALTAASCAGLGLGSGARAEFEKGLGLFNAGSYEKAIPHFARATELEPEYAEAYIYLGRSHLSLGDYGKAVPPLRTAYELDSGQMRGEALNLLLDALLGGTGKALGSGNFSEAMDYLHQGALLLPQASPRAGQEWLSGVVTQGTTLLSRGETSRAVDWFAEILSFRPDNVDALIGAARAYFREGQYFQALSAAREAASRAPADDRVEALMQELIGR